eukprot:5308048-Pyramimonas_sp.AAC.1
MSSSPHNNDGSNSSKGLFSLGVLSAPSPSLEEEDLVKPSQVTWRDTRPIAAKRVRPTAANTQHWP